MTICKGKQLPEVFLNRKIYSNLSSDFPLDLQKLKEEQEKDKFSTSIKDDPNQVSLLEVRSDLEVYTTRSKTNQWKIYVPENHPGD